MITSDRGLAGAFNSNVLKASESVLKARAGEFQKVGLTLLGFLAANLLGRTLISLSETILDRMPVVREIGRAEVVPVELTALRAAAQGVSADLPIK